MEGGEQATDGDEVEVSAAVGCGGEAVMEVAADGDDAGPGPREYLGKALDEGVLDGVLGPPEAPRLDDDPRDWDRPAVTGRDRPHLPPPPPRMVVGHILAVGVLAGCVLRRLAWGESVG